MQNEDVETVYNGVNPEAETEVAPEYVENVNPAATPEETRQKDIEEGVESYAKAVGELGKSVGIKMNFKSQGIDRETWFNSIEKVAYLAYEDQCSPANPRVPVVEDMKKILELVYDTEEFM